jgi:putative ABC transport system permease protein
LLGGVRPALWILFGAAAVLLLIACANVMHLLLARSHARRREIAAQLALGAGRTRIARQLLVESGLLGVLGAALGVVIAHAALRTALVLTPVNLIRMRGVELDLQVLAFAALLALAATLAAGLAPALRLSGLNVAGVMAASRGDVASMRRGARRLLVVSEIALSLVLVLGAALLARSFAELRRIDLGFEPRGVLTLRVQLPGTDYPDQERAGHFYRELVDRVATLPRVDAAGAVRVLPLSGTIGDWSLTIEHRTAPGATPAADWQIVTPGYLETLRLERTSGRFLTAADDEDGPMAAVINETMAARYWPGQDALGKRFHLGTLDQPWIEVVGIVRDVRRNAVVEDPRAEMYLPHAQFVRAKDGGSPQLGMTLVVRADGDPLSLLPLVREQVRALDSDLPISDVRTLDAVTAAALAQPRFTTVLLGAFAALALVLAATGLYGVISFVTARRTHEIGVRIALGAEKGAVTRLIMRDGLTMAATGVAIGLLGCVWLTRLLAGQLYSVVPLDPWAFAAAPAILLATAAIASYVPARRAAGLDPMTALRED